MKLSIVIPTYNRSLEIKRCLSDLVLQCKDKDCEIIIVDDGSTDATVVIAEDLLQDCSHKVIQQKHLGVSADRNKGLDVALGEYVTFIDSDDWVSEGFIDTIFSYIDTKVDVVIFTQYVEDYLRSRETHDLHLSYKGNVDFAKIKFDILSQKLNTVWAKLFNKDLLDRNSIRFDENMVISEDYMFVLQTLIKSKRIQIAEFIPYHYYRNENGSYAIGNLTERHLDSLIQAYSKSKSYIDELDKLQRSHVNSRYLQQTVDIVGRLVKGNVVDFAAIKKLCESELYINTTSEKYKKIKTNVDKYLLRTGRWKSLYPYCKCIRHVEQIKRNRWLGRSHG